MVTTTAEARERQAPRAATPGEPTGRKAAERGRRKRPPQAQGDKEAEEGATSARQREGADGRAGASKAPGERRGKRNRALGARGEEAAARFLETRGYHILERNWTCFAGEADIIAADEATLVFVEVKTRRGDICGLPSEAVGKAKREKYEKIALAYVTDHFFGEAVVRFDVVSITVIPGDRAFVRHHVGAYSAG